MDVHLVSWQQFATLDEAIVSVNLRSVSAVVCTYGVFYKHNNRHNLHIQLWGRERSSSRTAEDGDEDWLAM